MQVNFHIEKYKQSDVKGIKKEQMREQKETEYRNNVDPSRTHLNVISDVREDGKNWNEHIKAAKESTELINGKSLRKDAVVICSAVETVPNSWPIDAQNEYFIAKGKWFNQQLEEVGGADKDCVLTTIIHHDEDNPHATFAFIPLKDGKLQACNILTKSYLSRLQADSNNFTQNWVKDYTETHGIELEKLESYSIGSERGHLSEAQYKLEKTKQEISNLEEKAKNLNENFEKKNNELRKREEELASLTDSPDLKSYVTVLNENKELTEDVKNKNIVIDNLCKELNTLKDKFNNLKDKVLDASNKLGYKISKLLGLDFKEQYGKIYPSKEFVDKVNSISNEKEIIKPDRLRVIPDDSGDEQFKLIHLNSNNEYTTIVDGIDSRENAQGIKNKLSEEVKELKDEEKIKRTINL